MQGTQGIISQAGGQRNQNVSRGTNPRPDTGRQLDTNPTIITIREPIASDQIKQIQTKTNLTAASLAKAGVVILGTTATYYLAKATGIFSYFGLGTNTKASVSERTSVKLDELVVEQIRGSKAGRRLVSSVEGIESLSVNPIPDQNIIVAKPFTFEINGTEVFGSDVILNVDTVTP